MKTLVNILVCFTAFMHAFSQESWFPFKNLTERQGLADANIASIIKSNSGYLWFGSSEGLNRFDGKNCKVYHHLHDDTTSLSDDNINVLFEDRKQNLWIGTRNGLNLYDPINDRFKRFTYNKADGYSISSNEVWSISEDSTGSLWIGTMGGGLNRIITKKDAYQFIHYRHDSTSLHSISSDIVWSVAFDKDGYGWIGTEDGLNKFSVNEIEKSKASFTHYKRDSSKNSISDNSVWKVFVDRASNVWLLSFYGMLDVLPGHARKSFIHVMPEMEKNLHQSNIGAISFMEANDGKYWIGTDKAGLIRCNIVIDAQNNLARLNSFERFTHSDQDDKTLANNSIYSVYEDNNHLTWIGTSNGVSMYNPGKNLFDIFNLNADNRLRNSEIRICFTDPEFALMATDNEICLIDKRKQPRPFCSFEKSSEISCIYKTNAGDLLVGLSATHNIYRIHKEQIKDFISGRIKQVEPIRVVLPPELSEGSVFFIEDYDSERLLIGGYARLGLFDIRKNTFINFIQPADENANYIFRCIANNGKNVYAGADNGLFNLDKTALKRVQPRSGMLSSDRITSLLLKDTILYIGTISGLNAYNLSNGAMINYFMKDGLPDNNISSLAEDKDGNIWIATRNGLACLNTKTRQFRIYNEPDGLNSNQLRSVAFDESVLFVGGNKGVNTVSTSMLDRQEASSRTVITDFKIAGRSIFENPLKANSIRQNEPVHVGWRENNISLEFTTLDFTDPESVQYAYMLEGFDKDWIATESMLQVNYTNLPGGRYTFLLKYASNNGSWSQTNIAIPVIVSTAWFKAWWFYLLCALAVSALIYSFYRIRINRIMEMQRVRNKIARDLHDDVGSTLSTINILSGSAIKKIHAQNDQAEQMLKKISESSGKMMDVMSDIVWSINPDNDKLENMVVRMREYAARLLEPKDIKYTVTADDALVNLSLPLQKRRDFYLVFKEAVNNLAKYSDASQAEIILSVRNGLLELSVIDNGTGFDPLMVAHGNGLKNMKERAKNIGGEFNLTSSSRAGTRIILTVGIT